eukprot:15470073-Alexandrium_andersonii.AAC.1
MHYHLNEPECAEGPVVVEFGHGDEESVEKAVQAELEGLGNQSAENEFEAKPEEIVGEVSPNTLAAE